MKCPYCGETIPERLDTCPVCAEKIIATQAQPDYAPAQNQGHNDNVPADMAGNATPPQDVQKGSSRVSRIVPVVVVALLAVGGIWWWLSYESKTDVSEDEAEPEAAADTLREGDNTANAISEEEEEVPLLIQEENEVKEVPMVRDNKMSPVKAMVGKYPISIVLATEGHKLTNKNGKAYDGYLYYDSQGVNAKLWLMINGGCVYEFNDEGMNTGTFFLYQDIMPDGSEGEYIRHDGKRFPVRFPNGGRGALGSRVAQSEYDN